MAHRRTPSSGAAAVELHAAAGPFAVLWTQPYDRLAQRVSPAQLRVLLVLDQHGAQNLTALAEHLGAIPSSATRLCDRLVAAGLILRDVDRADRRVVSLSLSRDGRRLLDEFADQRVAALAAVTARMAADDRRALLRGLRAFAAAVRAAGDRPLNDD